MFAEYRKAASLLQFEAVSLKTTSVPKFVSNDTRIHANSTVNNSLPVDEECYDGSVVDGTIVWKACDT